MPLPWEAILTVKDSKDKISFVKIYFQYYDEGVPAYISFANAEGAVLELVPYIDGMINGAIKRIAISREIALPGGIKVLPLLGADIEEVGVFIFKARFSQPKINLPTIKDSLIVDGSDEIDQSDSDVSAFIFRITDGSGTPLEFYKPSDNRDDEIFSFVDAYEKFRRSGKR